MASLRNAEDDELDP
jgi:hypothetical protein